MTDIVASAQGADLQQATCLDARKNSTAPAAIRGGRSVVLGALFRLPEPVCDLNASRKEGLWPTTCPWACLEVQRQGKGPWGARPAMECTERRWRFEQDLAPPVRPVGSRGDPSPFRFADMNCSHCPRRLAGWIDPELHFVHVRFSGRLHQIALQLDGREVGTALQHVREYSDRQTADGDCGRQHFERAQYSSCSSRGTGDGRWLRPFRTPVLHREGRS